VIVALGVLGLLVAHVAGGASAPTTAASRPSVRPTQELAVLIVRHTARAAPRKGAARLRVVAARRPITEERTVLPVLTHATDNRGRRWLRVRLPGRPNGRAGWIEQAGTLARETRWHLVVDLSRRRVVVFRSGKAVTTFRAIVGKPTAPTPRGEFFVEEAVALPAHEVGAPFALALSARSERPPRTGAYA
jgi:hypothetical protein